jgi:polyhydroxyalkanoate synthesis regulator phasin
VSSFAASLERFYEFALRIMLESMSGSDDLFTPTWKLVRNQSERQLGAFIFLWTAQFNEQPTILSEKDSKFRNEVVHKGKIPSEEEAIRFGNSVLEIVRPKLKIIRENFGKELQAAIFRQIIQSTEKSGITTGVSTLSINPILGVNQSGNQKEQLLENHLIELKKSCGMMNSHGSA